MSLDERTTNDEPMFTTSQQEPTCHLLPCSVDFSGCLAGAEHLFQPTPLVMDNHDDDNDSPQQTTKRRVLAATLRGRGLLGKEETLLDNSSLPNDSPTMAASLVLFKVADSGETLAVEGPNIGKVVEWQHEHIPESLQHVKSRRLGTARAWLQVARALHEPLPPPPEQF